LCVIGIPPLLLIASAPSTALVARTVAVEE
jgi:hypothetical protein